MAHLRVACLCGAIYEVIENESPLKDQWPSKCVLCDRELFPPGKAIGQVRLVWRPDEIGSDALQEQVHGCKAYRYTYRWR